MKKIYSQNSGTGKEWKKSIPTIREREGNEKKTFPQLGDEKSEATILKNTREQEREWKKT